MDDRFNAAPPRITDPLRPKPYLSAQELAALTPWTEQAIKDMMRAGKLLEGTHFFRVGRRIVFKWDAVVELIESNAAGRDQSAPLATGAFPETERRARLTRRAGA